MAVIRKTASEVALEVTGFAQRHGLLTANAECLQRHAARYLALGHCPCVEARPECPCAEALGDIESMGRCECGILIDPARLCMLRDQRDDR